MELYRRQLLWYYIISLHLFALMNAMIVWQKGGDLTQSYDKSPYTNRNVKGAK